MRPHRMLAYALVTACALIVNGPGEVEAGTVIDQQSLPVNVFEINTTNSNFLWQQEVTAGFTGTLVGVDVYGMTAPGQSNVFDLHINLGSAWQTDANDFLSTESPTVNNDWHFVDTSSAGISIQAGDKFVIGILPRSSSDTWGVAESSGDHYAGGALWLESFGGTPEPQAGGGTDLIFRSYMLVPDPPDADGDGMPGGCDCDYDQNGTCGFGDFSILLTCFGQSVPGAGPPDDPTCAESDQDGNGVVGFDDFTLLLFLFGQPPGLAHDVCTTGVPLPSSCDPCIDAVCAVLPSCCSGAWDAACVTEVGNVCVSGPTCP